MLTGCLFTLCTAFLPEGGGGGNDHVKKRRQHGSEGGGPHPLHTPPPLHSAHPPDHAGVCGAEALGHPEALDELRAWLEVRGALCRGAAGGDAGGEAHMG